MFVSAFSLDLPKTPGTQNVEFKEKKFDDIESRKGKFPSSNCS